MRSGGRGLTSFARKNPHSLVWVALVVVLVAVAVVVLNWSILT